MTVDTLEELCNLVGNKLSQQDTAQAKIESMLDYLQEWNIIPFYNADKLDWLFGNDESY